MFDLENLFRFSVFSRRTHIKDCFYFYYFSFVYTSIQNNYFSPCFPTGASVCHFEFIVCPTHEVYPCYNAVLLDIDELVSFCYLQLAFSAREINLFDLLLMCDFRPFVHSCLLGCNSRVYVLLISPEFLL